MLIVLHQLYHFAFLPAPAPLIVVAVPFYIVKLQRTLGAFGIWHQALQSDHLNAQSLMTNTQCLMTNPARPACYKIEHRRYIRHLIDFFFSL